MGMLSNNRPDPKPERVVKPKKWLNKTRKPSGELEIFKQIWQERDHVCEWCGCYIHSFDVSLFDHIIEKSKAPSLRLEKTNIRILCRIGHYLRHNGTKEKIQQHINIGIEKKVNEMISRTNKAI
jgi:hypothetical protein